jgi:uncharacterized protein (DUF427 family)
MVASPAKAAASQAANGANGHSVEVEPSPRWVRVAFNGVTVADSKRALLLRETRLAPVYYFPRADVRLDLMSPTELHTRCPWKGEASYWTLKVGDKEAANAVWSYPNPLPGREDITEYMAFYWNRVDRWYEEEEEIFVHPRDPYHRVDSLPSARHVRVAVGDQTIAESSRPVLLFETGLPTRYYVPREDVRLDQLEPTETTSRCPYKGIASDYWRLKGGESEKDIAWSYPDPIAESPKIKGLIAFFNERTDIWVDGTLTERPKTPWS